MRVEPYRSARAAAWVRLMNLVRPVPIGLAEFEAREAAWPPGDLRLRYLGRDGGRTVGLAQAAVSPYAPADRLAAVVVVDPARRRRGHGSALLAALEDEARRRGVRGLVGTVVEDARPARAWVEARGFRRFAVRIDSVLDLAGFDPGRWTSVRARVKADGVTFAGMEGAGEAAWRELLALFRSLLADTPDMRGLPPWTEERCRAVLRDNPVARPGWIVVARHGGEAIGLAVGHVLGDGVYAYFTGVRRGWRGRGIGLALKLALIDAARAQGVATMRATNLDRNGPIWRVNDALGFRRLLGTIEYRKPLSPAGRRPAR